tara:strand:+ start:637 stop:831 length:195 start_codon:yes stop_codon:yes gene_type:complete
MPETTLDTAQEVRIAVLQAKVERIDEKQKELTDRVSTAERWIAGAGAVIAAASTVIGVLAQLSK